MRVSSCLARATLALLLVSCTSHPRANHQPKAVTVNELLTAPDKFNGTRVSVRGFLLEPMVGDIAIFQDAPNYHRYRPETGIPLALDPNKHNLTPFQLKRCLVEGTFHAGGAPGGHSQIGEIRRLELAD